MMEKALVYENEYIGWKMVNNRFFVEKDTRSTSPPLPTHIVEGVFGNMDDIFMMFDGSMMQNINLHIRLRCDGKRVHYWKRGEEEEEIEELD